MSNKPTRLPMQAAVAICLATLLAACGASNDDALKLPEPVGAAGAAGGGQAAGGSGSTPADDPSALAQADGDAEDGNTADTNSDDEADGDWPELREIPDGTLTWTVVYTGTGTTQSPEMKEVAVLHRELHGTAHMRGFAGNPGEAPPPTPMDDINRAMEACGEDMGCQQAIALRMMAGKDPASLERGMRDAMAEAQRDTIWGAATCGAVGMADDRATWSGMTPLGFNTGEGTRAGKRSIEDCIVQQEERDTRPSLVADDNSKTYRLALPSAEIRVKGELGGRVDPNPRIVEFPPLLIEHIRYARLDRPLKGSATVRQGKGHGLWSEGWDIALTEKISWTFTPD